MEEERRKLPYIPPQCEVYEYAVEHGFAHTEAHGRTMGSQDQWGEIQDYSQYGHAGENQTGNWLDDTEW